MEPVHPPPSLALTYWQPKHVVKGNRRTIGFLLRAEVRVFPRMSRNHGLKIHACIFSLSETFSDQRKGEVVVGLDVSGRYRYPPPAPAWLAQRVEDVIDPALPIVDAHHHLWNEGGHPYLLDEMLEDAGDGHRIVATIFVQAHYG
jgi:hypothetical protein